MTHFSRGSVISSLMWKFVERCSVQLVSFIVSVVLARLLCPEDYGLIALVNVFINLSSVIVEGGLNTALIQKKDSDKTDFSTIFYTSLAVAGLLYFILFFSAHSIAQFYNKPSLVPVIRILGFTLFFYAINSIQKAFLTKRIQFKKLFYSSFGAIVASGILGIILAFNGCGVWALVAQTITAQFATTVIMWITVDWRPTLEFSISRFKLLFDYGWKIFASNMLVSLFINIRSVIIGKVYSAGALALFDRGKQFPALIIDNINSSIQSVLFPVLSAEQDDRTIIKSMVRRSIKISSFIIFPLVIGLIITAEPLIQCLLTDKWLGTVPFMRIFCAAYMLMPMQIANVEAIKSLGFSGKNLKLELIKKCIEFAILLATVPISAEAIAWGIVGYNGIALFINMYPNKKYLNYGILEQIKDIMPSLGTSILMGCLIFFVSYTPIAPGWILLLEIIIGLTAYIIFNALFKIESFNYLLDIIRPYLKMSKTNNNS